MNKYGAGDYIWHSLYGQSVADAIERSYWETFTRAMTERSESTYTPVPVPPLSDLPGGLEKDPGRADKALAEALR